MVTKKIILCFIFAVALSIKQPYAHAEQIMVDSIVASVQGAGVITNVQLVQYAAVSAVLKSGYDEAVKDLNDHQFMKMSLDKLIDRTLMLKDAQLLSITPPDQKDITDMIAMFRVKFKSDNDYNNYTKQYAITDGYLKKYMADTLIVRQYLNDEVKMLINVTNKDIEQYYESNRDKYNGISKQAAEKEIKALLEQKEYDKQLKSWIKTLMLHRQIIIMY